METGFNIYEQLEPVNKDITITFNPDSTYISYKLTIIKDNEVYKEIAKSVGENTKLTLSESGIYIINITYYNQEGNETYKSSGNYIIDKEKPVITIEKNYIEVKKSHSINIMKNITATDNLEGNLTNNIKTNINDINFNIEKTQKIIYTVSDRAGNQSQSEVILKVIPNSPTMLLFQSILILGLLILLLGIYIYNKSVKLEQKISRFSISPLKDTSLSLFDSISIRLSNLLTSMNKILYKSEFIKKYSKKYTKYIRANNQINKTNMDFISTKIICSIFCLIVAVFSKTIQLKTFRIYHVYFPMIFGFFIPDFIYYFKYKSYKRKIENDLLEAIIIMNNAFKSGRSIAQAIELVSKELDGTIAEEFKKMHLELSFGLGLDVVFNRFSERIKIEEVAYLTASLTILNKTGGNIVEVFSSIEKSLFNKKKLNLELKSLTSGSRMIVKVLMIVPIAFILLIWTINPSYFLTLLSSKIGYLIIIIVLIYYTIYILTIKKLLQVKI